jgi:hypothetical protein
MYLIIIYIKRQKQAISIELHTASYRKEELFLVQKNRVNGEIWRSSNKHELIQQFE